MQFSFVVFLFSVKPFIGSYFISEWEYYAISLNDSMLITGLVFDNVDQLDKFCIYYDVNGRYLPYKESKLFYDDIVSFFF